MTESWRKTGQANGAATEWGLLPTEPPGAGKAWGSSCSGKSSGQRHEECHMPHGSQEVSPLWITGRACVVIQPTKPGLANCSCWLDVNVQDIVGYTVSVQSPSSNLASSSHSGHVMSEPATSQWGWEWTLHIKSESTSRNSPDITPANPRWRTRPPRPVPLPML